MNTTNSGAIHKKDFDPSVRPQDDFFQFAAGGWIKRNKIPKTEVRWGSFYILRDENRKRIKQLFADLLKGKWGKSDKTMRLLADFYRSGIDEKTIARLGISPLQPLLDRIDKVANQSELLSLLAHLHTLHIDLLWSPSVSLDEKDSDKMALYLSQGDLGLPEREYYLSNKGKFPLLRKKYLKYIAKQLMFIEISQKAASAAAQKILALETRLARAAMSATQRRDVIKCYNKMTARKLHSLAPQIDWSAYFDHIKTGKVKTVIVSQPNHLRLCGNMLMSVPLDDWKNYCKFHLVSKFAGMLPEAIGKESFDFYGKTLTGQKERKPRWQRVIGVVDSAMTEALGKAYVARHFSKDAEAMMREMVENLIAAYRARIKRLDWMTAVTKKKALKKLSTFRTKLVQPKHPRDYRELSVSPDRYLKNVMHARQSEFFREIGKLERPIDRSEWYMGAHVVNAYYWPNQNEIVFPAGILQPPFFDPKGDVALNYGSIGAIIGHELTHGFDDKGSLFDERGNLHNWWTAKDRKAFLAKTNIIKKQYSRFQVDEETFVNGELTLGENIADLGGVVLAYDALQVYMQKHGRLKNIGGFTPEQRYFFGNVVSERGHERSEAKRLGVLSDPHAPEFTRVNGPLMHLESFYSAFDVKKGDKMYRQPSLRANIW